MNNRMNHKSLHSMLLFAMCVVAVAASGAVAQSSRNPSSSGCSSCRLFVKPGIPGNTGLSWADAFNTLQDALFAAANSQGQIVEIWVARGLYRPDRGGSETLNDRNATFKLASGLTIRGGFFGNENPNTFNLADRVFTDNPTELSGDLLRNDVGDSFRGENSYHVVTAIETDDTAILDGFIIRAGNADGTGLRSLGGGMNIQFGFPTILNCVILDNSAGTVGGGAYLLNSDATFFNCRFVDNTALDGGGLFVSVGGNSPIFANTQFRFNTADDDGGGIVAANTSSPVFVNCTIAYNTAGDNYGGVFALGGGAPRFINSILWGNVSANDVDVQHQQISSVNVDVLYSCIQDDDPNDASIFPGTGNIDNAPRFVDVGNGNLRLRPDSPCIDAAATPALPPDLADLDHDGNTVEPLPLDAERRTRVVDVLSVPDTGVGDIVVDMGAFEFSLDCNMNGVDDLIDILKNDSLDCNRNGVPDECEISKNSDIPGGPFFCTENCDPDCNNNGVPDSCDIASCPQGLTVCDDCNNNGVPDGCDIEDGTSSDDNKDGIPDSCSSWSDRAVDNRWGRASNWDPPTIPDNVGEQRFNVNLADSITDVLLDIDATVDTLRIRRMATLRVTLPADVVTPNLKIDTEEGMLIQGRLLVGFDRSVILPSGGVVIGPGGLYAKDAQIPALSGAKLIANELTILEGAPGGEMRLTDAMNVVLFGDLLLDGTNAFPPAFPSAAVTCTPPILRVRDSASLDVEGDTEFIESVDVSVKEGAAAGEESGGFAIPQVEIAGSFINHSFDPQVFDWVDGGLSLDGNSPMAPQRFEVAGMDIGPFAAGFSDNFGFGVIDVASGSSVIFEDNFDNDGDGQSACTEALYVKTLVLGDGAFILLDNVRIYYNTLIDDGASIVMQGDGCASLVPITADCDLDGEIDLNDYAAFFVCQTGPAAVNTDPGCQCADINGDNHIDSLDFRELQILFTMP